MTEIQAHIREPSGISRQRWPLTWGVPLAQGQWRPDHAINAIDSNERARSICATPLATWPDASVKWALIDTQIDIEAGERLDLRLQIFYIIIVVVFGVLIAIALTQFLIRDKALNEDLAQLQQHAARQEERQNALREEFDSIALDLQVLEQEKSTLQAQDSCMRKLDQFNAAEDITE
ncbi:MAG: RIFT barrel domain-containing protein [Candidatus Latescibacterota bacterium]|jgi:hypothetical protein